MSSISNFGTINSKRHLLQFACSEIKCIFVLPYNTASGVPLARQAHHTNPVLDQGSFTLSAAEIEGIGSQAYVRGTWTFTGKMDTTQFNDNGKFIMILKKQGSDWKVFRETWNHCARTPFP